DPGIEVRDMKWKYVVCAVLAATPGYAQPAQTLTMEQAVEIALRQQPVARQRRAQLEAARGRIDQVRAILRPQLSLNAGASAGGGGGVFNPEPGEPSRAFLEPSGGASIGASASWRIWDFGQTSAQLRAA